MTESHEELLQIADRLDRLTEQSKEERVQEPLDQLYRAASEIGNAWSGSWLGYHANVYYKNFNRPPKGAHFSPEWGLMDTYDSSFGSRGDWQEYDSEEVKEAVQKSAGDPDLRTARKFNRGVIQEFDTFRSEALSIIEIELANDSDSLLCGAKEGITDLSALSTSEVAENLNPKRQIETHDLTAKEQGNRLPTHMAMKAEVMAIRHTFGIVQNLSKYSRKIASHLSRRRQRPRESRTVGTNVFIGHGQSQIWRELKDFIEDRLALSVDEFNRVPIAGVTNISRLSEMLDAAAIAFLIMTGEDEQSDGKSRARMNVVHEAGLFQGRLGFTRAIVLLEDGCEEFSNINGLGYIPFPKGNINAGFEKIRQVLEREKIIEPK